MGRYLLQRILLAAPTLLLISLAVFGLSKCAPGDPVTEMNSQELKVSADPAQSAEYYRYGAEKLGLDKPVFYFKLTSAAFPKPLWKIYPLERRKRLTSLIAQTGNWQAVETYDAALNKSLLEMERISDSCLNVKYLRQELLSMSTQHGLTKLIQPLSRADSLAQTLPVSYAAFIQTLTGLKSATQQLQTTPQKHLLYIPVVYWYGFN
ncbi:MAG: hypothetical protein JNJ57_10785, partial [Saprospiraceae bacterium]|nr:hypothetical protein [Saprospiraceae bacterium]